jgi:polar amino acid transport system permease protein
VGEPRAGVPARDEPVRIQVTDGLLIPSRGEKTLFSSWRIAMVGALTLLVGLPLFAPDPYFKILQNLPDGILTTFEVTILSILLASVFGLMAGLGQISRVTLINRIATVYVEVIRGIPLLVQLFYLYFALGKFLHLQGMVAAVVSMAFCYGAYMGEIFRAGIQAVPRGQMEAALALGLSRTQAIRLVILPQTVKIVLPAIGNEFIALLKDSSLVSVLAITDLMRRGREFAAVTFQYFEAYTMVALVYLVLTLFLSRLVALMEGRLNSNGR